MSYMYWILPVVLSLLSVRYGRLLLRQLQLSEDSSALSELRNISEVDASGSAAAVKGRSSSGGEPPLVVEETLGRWTLYEGKPGRRAGHIVTASSYFDRLRILL